MLWGKQTAVFLDFEVPGLGKALSGTPLSDALAALNRAGVAWISYRKNPTASAGKAAMLVTEADVSRAFHTGQTELALQAGAIVTPLAKDAANELGVRLKAPEVS